MVSLFENDRSLFEKEYLSKAKEKAQFMSCFLALYKNYQIEDRHLNIPVLFDATCSGMQHLSALTTNVNLAALVNLTGGEPADFYDYCAKRIVNVITELSDKKLSEKLSQVKIDRKLVKLPVMTIPYNIGLEALTSKITDNFEMYFVEGENGKKNVMFKVPQDLTVCGKQPLLLNGHEAGKLGSIVFHTVNSLMPPIEPLKKYFRKMLNVLAKLNKPIFWITPAGMKIWGSTLATSSTRVKTSFLKNSKPVTIRLPTDIYDYKLINRALMANFIHSLDAANIHLLIELIISNPEYRSMRLNLYTIHDCFASTNADMYVMESLVKRAFSRLYFESNYLEELHNSIINQIRSYGELSYKVVDGKNIALITINGKSGGLISRSVSKAEVMEIPELPQFNWEDNKDYLKDRIMFAEYFIS